MAFRKFNIQVSKSEVIDFSDNLMVLGKENSSPTDIGFLGKIGTNIYTGLVRDAETNEFLLLDQIQLASTTINDVNALDASIVKGNITVGTLTADTLVTGNVEATSTFMLPKGTAAQRPASPVEGMMWFNTTTKMFEGYDGTNWVQLIPSTFVETP